MPPYKHHLNLLSRFKRNTQHASFPTPSKSKQKIKRSFFRLFLYRDRCFDRLAELWRAVTGLSPSTPSSFRFFLIFYFWNWFNRFFVFLEFGISVSNSRISPAVFHILEFVFRFEIPIWNSPGRFFVIFRISKI
eukprot:GABV01000832.1.p1 GENE.GABV01000832.1~~GABV01000832.1.p1  ORF type:complete len:134 (-),score=44.26 GABV01000832.1:24-425(-)